MTFKTQQEIWAHLVNGGKVINKQDCERVQRAFSNRIRGRK